MIIKAICEGPMMKGPGELPHQIVLRVVLLNVEGNWTIKEFMVHVAAFEDGKAIFSDGDYFPVNPNDPKPLEMYQAAFTKWQERTRRMSTHRLPHIEP